MTLLIILLVAFLFLNRQDGGNGGDGSQLTVEPDQAEPGVDVVLSGSGFPPNVDVTITIGGIERFPIDTDANGDFVRQRQIPPELPPGDVQIVASAGGRSASVDFTVLDPGGNGNGNGGTPGAHITGINFKSNTRRGPFAQGSDNWPVTWADDDDQYTSFGDGAGFQGNTLHSLGFARITGGPDNWDGDDLFESGSRGGSGSGTGKSYAILGLNGGLLSFVTPGSGTTGYDHFTLRRSSNHGRDWNDLYTFNREEGPGHGFIKPALLQFGRDYAGARDNFVYSYVIENTTRRSDLSVQQPGRIHLLRCPISGLGNKGNWEAFSGTPSNPSWSGDFDDSRPVFTDSRGVGWNLSVIYNLGLKRYILCTEHTRSFEGRFQFHDAPEPWGPWQKIDDVRFNSDSFYGNFSQKWMSADGRNFVFIYTGIGGGQGGDALTTIDGAFEVGGSAGQVQRAGMRRLRLAA